MKITMDNHTHKLSGKPDCYGNLKKVFPMTKTGLRETPHYCRYDCSYKTECLKKALASSKGSTVEEELLERGSKAGTIGFVERWSRRKQLDRRKD